MLIALMAAILAAGGTYLVLQRGMLRTIIGMTLISHATNLIVLSTGVGRWRGEPLLGDSPTQEMADPLPQAFVLTAIVITMAVTAFMLAMAALGHDDDTRIHEDREAMRQLSTAGRKARKHIPSDSDSTVQGTPGILGDRTPDARGHGQVNQAPDAGTGATTTTAKTGTQTNTSADAPADADADAGADSTRAEHTSPKHTNQAGDSQW